MINPSSGLFRARPKRVCQKHPSECQCKGRSDRCSVLGATAGKVPHSGCGERERDDAASLKEEAGCWRRGCSGGAHGLCLLGEGLASKASVNLG